MVAKGERHYKIAFHFLRLVHFPFDDMIQIVFRSILMKKIEKQVYFDNTHPIFDLFG